MDCPQGTDSILISCSNNCLGTYSFAGAVGSTSCFGILQPPNGGLVRLRVRSHLTFLTSSTTTSGGMAVLVPKNAADHQHNFQYIDWSLQIKSVETGLCLDDGGHEDLWGVSTDATFTFTSCDSTNINQQFVFTSNKQIYNPNWPNNNLCLNGNGQPLGGNLALLTWICLPTNNDEIFDFFCPAGNISIYDLNGIKSHFLRNVRPPWHRWLGPMLRCACNQ